jgi:hypothetical protein
MNIDQITEHLIKNLLPENLTPVKEVGEGSSKAFPAIKEHDDVDLEDGYLFGTTVYSFTDSKDQYYTVILEYEGLEVTVSFTADESFEQTNSNELYAVVTTVFQILKQDISQPPKNLVNLIKYTPASTKGKPGQSQKGADQRDRVYQAYFKRMFPNATVEKEGPDTVVYLEEAYKGKRTNDGAPGTFKAKITKAYGGPVTIEKAKKFKNRENATAHDKRQANWFINFHSKNEGLTEVGDASASKYEWEEADREGYFTYIRFVTDSETEYDVDLETMTYTPKDSTSGIKAIGVEFSAKPKDAEFLGGSSNIVVNKGELYKVMATVLDIIKKYLKEFKAQAIIYTPSKKSNEDFGNQRDQVYKAFISKAFPEVKFEQKGDMMVAILPSTTYLTIDEIDDLQENIEPAKTSGKAAPYGSGYKPLEETLEPLIAELTKYMYEEGLPIDPAPTVEFIEDEVNAQNPLGRTAYYDPQNRHIALYVTSRHPKDILRSFAHEMIHHMQNLEGRLGNMPNTVNVNEDDHLKSIEEEAYKLGNIYFRSWENNKNKVK